MQDSVDDHVARCRALLSDLDPDARHLLRRVLATAESPAR